MKTKYKAIKRGGRMVLIDHAPFQADMQTLKEGEVFFLIVKRRRKDTGSDEDSWRRYYWAVVAAAIAEHTGHSKEMCHEALKLKIVGYKDEKTGLTMIPSVLSDASGFSLEQKKAFIQEVRKWAFDFLDLPIPDRERAIY